MRLKHFVSTRQYAQLSTLNAEGDPIASYAPCVLREEGIYVFLSQLSGHCKNLLHDQRVGVLLLGDEADARNPFARQRVSYQSRAVVLAAEHTNYDSVLDELADKQGKTVELLRQLPDFILFCLQPCTGTYIEGFGKAFELSGPHRGELQHVDEKAVRSRR